MSTEDTKQKIINATGELAAERGIDNVSTRAIAQRSGENIGSIHYHFGGKEGLLEAVARASMHGRDYEEEIRSINALGASPSKEALSRVLREAVAREITDLFRSGRPNWHSQIIFQLLQRDDGLYEILRKELLNPGMDAMARLFLLIDPTMSPGDIFLHTTLMKMPIFSHANDMKAIQKRLGVDSYSEEYLQKMEDLLVKQTQRLLDLPED